MQRGVPTFPSTAEVRAFSEGYTPQSATQGPRAAEEQWEVGWRGRNSPGPGDFGGGADLETEDPLARSES